MPHYDYACRGCPGTLKVRQDLLADPIRICPACSKKLLYRTPAVDQAASEASGLYQEHPQ